MFNAKKYREENPEQRTLPVGWYKVKAETSELKQSSAGANMVTISIRILDSLSGHFINALQWENLTIGHESEQVRKFANDKLAEIMLASGVDEIEVWSDIAFEGKEFAMSIGKSAKTGRVYAVYRPLAMWDAMVTKHYGAAPAPATNGLIDEPYVPVHVDTQPQIDFEDDILF